MPFEKVPKKKCFLFHQNFDLRKFLARKWNDPFDGILYHSENNFSWNGFISFHEFLEWTLKKKNSFKHFSLTVFRTSIILTSNYRRWSHLKISCSYNWGDSSRIIWFHEKTDFQMNICINSSIRFLYEFLYGWSNATVGIPLSISLISRKNE